MELLTIADAEQAVIDELSDVFSIGTSIPDNKPPIFLRVVAAGGLQGNLVTDRPMLVLEAFAPREGVAHQTLATALGLLELAVHKGRVGNEVAYVLEVAGLPQNSPLPSVPSHRRYISTITLALRRRVITL